MDEEYNTLILGALLHDIGKVILRGIGTTEGDHSEIGAQFLESFKKELSVFAKFHHKKYMEKIPPDITQKMKNLLWIVYEADNLSSMERGEKEGEFNPKNPLISIFSRIRLENKEVKEKAYPLTVLRFNEIVFPSFDKNNAEDRIPHKSYEKIFDDFKYRFPLISPDLVLSFLEKETTYIPARTGEDEDISLFDHLKTTCAIASCLYLYHKDELDKDIKEKILDRKEKKYILVSGDISGIQKFIYNITSKGSLRLLRARSFMLEILSEDVTQELLTRLNLSRANLLYCAGGHFYIIAPNTEESIKKINELKEQLNEWLLKKFDGELYYAIGWSEISGEEFNNFSEVWHKIGEILSKEKSQKFKHILTKEPDKLLMESGYEKKKESCKACKKFVERLEEIKKGEEIIRYCEECRRLLSIGENLIKASYILRFKDAKDYDLELPFSKIKITNKIEENFDTIFHINSLDPPDEILKMKKEKNKKEFIYAPLPLPNYAYGTGNLDELAEKATGIKKIGVLRMDVDRLGDIFRRGLPKEKRTISRITNLSRFLNYFFKAYINLLGNLQDKNIEEIINTNWKIGEKIKRLAERKERKFVIVYGGGDDLLIVGSWDDVIELAFDINSLFRKYVGENDNITISGSFCIFDEKFPFYKIAQISGEKEKIAKDEGKNRIWLFERGVNVRGIFKESLEWDKFLELWKDFAPLLNGNKLVVSKANIGKLLSINNYYKENFSRIDWAVHLSYWYGRLNEKDKKIFERIVKKYSVINRQQPSKIYYIDIPLRILDLATRGEKYGRY
ncbi:MAG: type III-A CRISPR-associated protein Cas10/Csm1 [Candidatus Thermoplasmatota archaeon]